MFSPFFVFSQSSARLGWGSAAITSPAFSSLFKIIGVSFNSSPTTQDQEKSRSLNSCFSKQLLPEMGSLWMFFPKPMIETAMLLLNDCFCYFVFEGLVLFACVSPPLCLPQPTAGSRLSAGGGAGPPDPPWCHGAASDQLSGAEPQCSVGPTAAREESRNPKTRKT